MKLKLFFNLWVPVIVWLAVIFTLSSFPTLPSPKIIWWDFILKKSAHMIEYGILYFLLFRAFASDFKLQNLELKNQNRQIKINLAVSVFIFTLLYAFSDEFHQSFVPGRHAALMDVGFDFTGALISHRLIVHKIRVRP